MAKDSFGGKISGGPITKANGKEPQSTLEKDQSKEVRVGENKRNGHWSPPGFNTVIISVTALLKSKSYSCDYLDDNILAVQTHHVDNSIASSSKDSMHTMRVGMSKNEITKRELPNLQGRCSNGSVQ